MSAFFNMQLRLPPSERIAGFYLFFLVGTIPLFFGAVHPFIQSLYVFLIVLGLGGWGLFFTREEKWCDLFSYWMIIPVFLLSYMLLQSVPVSVNLLEIITPARAERIRMVNTLTRVELSVASISDNGVLGLLWVFFLVSMFLYYLVVRILLRTDRKMLQHLLVIIAGVGIFEGLYGLLQSMNPHAGILWLPLQERAAHGTIIYTNQYASFLNMCWPLAIAGGLLFSSSVATPVRVEKKKSKWRELLQTLSSFNGLGFFLFFAAAVMILAVLFSSSRGGILVTVLQIMFLNIFLPLSRKLKFTLSLLLLIFLIGYGSLLGFERVLSQFNTIDQSGVIRFQMYLSSIPLLLDHWLTGIGPGSFKLLSGVYLKGFPEALLIDRVHNDFLEFAIEVGLPCFALGFLWVGRGIIVSGCQLFDNLSDTEPVSKVSLIVAGAAYCSLFGFLVHGLVDFGWRLPANFMYAVTITALLSHALQCLNRNAVSSHLTGECS